MNRDYIYNEIITEKMGKPFRYKVENIKSDQCETCVKCGKNACRLEISKDKCINEERRRRKWKRRTKKIQKEY